MTIAEGLANIEALRASQHQLSDADRAEYERICTRLDRANCDLRRAKNKGDTKKIATAERAIARHTEARKAFVEPRVGPLWAPARIIARFSARWSGPSGVGMHHHECEMVLDHKDISGPSYRTVRVLRDEGGPPTNARGAPDTMGVAWFAVADLTVLGEEEPS